MIRQFLTELYSMMKLVGNPMAELFDSCADHFEVFARFLAMVEVDFWCICCGSILSLV